MPGMAQPNGRPLFGSELRSYFWLFVDQSILNWVCLCGSVRSLERRFLTDDILLRSEDIRDFAIKSRICAKSHQNFDVFGQPNLGGKGHHFWPNFYKPGSLSTMRQSLVTTGHATSEIRWRKKDLNYRGKTEWPAEIIVAIITKQ